MKDIPWWSEVPTLVLGFSISHGLSSYMLPLMQCMQFAQSVSVHSKSDVISNEIMEDMADTLVMLGIRVLVYRDGVSVGDFKHVLEHECGAIMEDMAETLLQLFKSYRNILKIFCVDKKISNLYLSFTTT